jgi:uracil-DNA glycosylase
MRWWDLQFFRGRVWAEINSHLIENPNYYPHESLLFEAFSFTSFRQTRVVILGQDPYPTPGHAHGLAFSVLPSVTPLPKSLQNIFKELVSDTGCAYPSHGYLKSWARQGVLLLNTSLSVEAGQPGSHSKLGWNNLVEDVINALNSKEKVIWVLWGRHAQSFEPLINPKHPIIKSAHPSPLSARRGFFGSKPFSKINEFLEDKIDWELT